MIGAARDISYTVLGCLAVGGGIGWLFGFIHGRWVSDREVERKSREAQRRSRDHLNIGGPHYRF